MQSPSKKGKAAPENNIDTLTAKSQSSSCNIKVFIRVRPALPAEFQKEVAVSANKENNTIIMNTRTDLIQTKFDQVFDANSTQLQVFDRLKFLIPQVLEGFHSTVFAYGQTGSGKTHSMFGSDWENLFATSNQRNKPQKTFVQDIENDKLHAGIIPRTIYNIFKDIADDRYASKKFTVYCSFLQIYNEKIFDLFQDKKTAQPLQIRENKFDGIFVEGLTEYSVLNFEECLRLMQRGENNRATRQTSQNVKSSRSHTIFQLSVESTLADEKGRLQKSKLNLCDLAGSEKLRKQEEIELAHLKELKGINLSLTTLGSKIPIPYRESKLTRLLQDSLGGNTQTCLIATISPTIECIEESISTIKFAERASHIVTQVKPNQISATDDQLVKNLKKEIEYLREILKIRRQGGSAIGEVHNKLLILKEENDRLRQSQISIEEVEKLLQENRTMKQELQKLKSNNSDEVGAHINSNNQIGSQVIDYKEFKEGLESRNNLGLVLTPSNLSSPSKFEESDRFLVANNNYLSLPNSPKNFDFNFNNQKGDSHHVKGLLSRDSLSSVNHAMEKRSLGLIQTGKLLSGTSSLNIVSGKSKILDVSKTEINMRVRGKGNTAISKGFLERSVDEQKRIEERRKNQLKALERMEEFEKLKKHHEAKLKLKLDQLSFDREFNSGSLSTSSSKQSAYKTKQLESLYNPYQIRAEIENKYKDKQGASSISAHAKKIEDYNYKIKRIEQNFLK